jgi:hypothetical protein
MGLFRRKRGDLVSEAFAEPTRVLLGHPREMPSSEKLAKLGAVCAGHSEVAEAFLTQRLIPGPDETPTILLGVRLDDASRASNLFRDIGDALHPLRPGEKTLDFQILDERPSDVWISVYQRG